MHCQTDYFSRLGLDGSKLSALIDAINNIDTIGDKEEDTVGRVYEPSGARQTARQGSPKGERGGANQYFPGKFAASEGKLGGEWSGATWTSRQACPEGERGGVHQFYTPKCVVNLIAEMIEPYKGKIYDPCCGSGGSLPPWRPCGVRFAERKRASALGIVQSLKFVESHHGNTKDISVYGQEQTATTYKLAKMNLAVCGLSANLGEVPADTFFKDQHPDLKANYIMANPPSKKPFLNHIPRLTHDCFRNLVRNY